MRNILNIRMKITIIIISIITTSICLSQDIHFSQFYNTPLVINPSLSGGDDGTFNGVINYKNQWGKAYNTYGASADGGLMRRIDRGFLGLGGFVYNDRQGDVSLNKLHAKLAMSYHTQMSRQQYFNAGISGGIVQTSIDRNKMIWDNQYDGLGYNASIPSNEILFEQNSLSPDFSLGINYLYKENEYVGKRRFLIGLAVHNMVRIKDAMIETNVKNRSYRYVLHSEASLPIRNTKIEVQPSAFFSLQGVSKEFFIGSNFRYQIKEESRYTNFSKESSVTFGLFAREIKSIIAYAGFQIDKYNIGISYDINISGYSVATSGKGGLEISLKYVNLTKFNRAYTPAPRL